MFSLGNGSVMVGPREKPGFHRFTALDIEEVLSGAGGDQLHVMVDDIKSFDTVDRSILGCAPGRLGLPSWLRKKFLSK